jgi:DNA-binding Lrp family transcriptional regulator
MRSDLNEILHSHLMAKINICSVTLIDDVMRRDLVGLLTRVVSWILVYLPLVLMLLILVDLVKYLVSYGVSITSQLFLGSLSTLVFLVILMVVGYWLGLISNRINDEIETELTSFLLSTQGPIPVGKIAEYLNISIEHARKTFLKVKSKGMLKEFTFDAESMEIIPQIHETTGMARLMELERLKAEGKIDSEAYRVLIELEKLRSEGKVSEEVYRRLRRELEGARS